MLSHFSHTWRPSILLLIPLLMLLASAIAPSTPSYAQKPVPPAARHSDVRDALRFRHLQLQDERGQIPTGAYIRANAQIKRMRAAQAAKGPLIAGINASSWTPVGPGNRGGRVRAIVPIDANTIFVGSVGGGIWKTTNAGVSWSPVDDFMANLAIATMVVDPGSSSVMYAGTGEGFGNFDAIQGAGIFKSTDGGTTWNQLASTNNANFNWVNRVAVSPDSSTLLAATGSGIWRSTDGGSFWSQRTLSGALQVVFHPSDNIKAVAGTGSGALYSTDGGLTWTGATGLTGGRVELAYALTSPTTVYASVDNNQGELYKSTDGGHSYSAVNTGRALLGAQGWYDNSIWVDATNANTLVVGGVGPLWRSTDGGVSFAQINNCDYYPTSPCGDDHAIVSAAGFDGSGNTTVYLGNDGGVYKNDDIYTAGINPPQYTNGWHSLNNDLRITQFFSAAGNTSTGAVWGGAQDNGLNRFDGNLADVNEWALVAGGDGGFMAADQTDAHYFYGELQFLSVLRSTDQGVTAEAISGVISCDASGCLYKSPPYLIPDAQSQNTNFIAPLVMDPNDANRLLAGGASLWRTDDARTSNTDTTGPSWASIKAAMAGDRISTIAIAPGNSDLIWVGYNSGAVYRTTNGTTASPTWVRMDNNTPPLPNRYVGRIAIDPARLDTVYVTFGGFNPDNVWRTTNGGTNWSVRVGSGANQLPAAPVFGLAVHPMNSSWIYAATEVGIFASEDGGNTWNLPQDGPANVSTDELQWMGNTLLAATHGRGAYEAAITAPTGGDISVTKTGPSSVTAGTDVTYHIAVANGGPGDASIVTLSDNTPPNTTFVSLTQNTGPAFQCSNPTAGGTGAVSCYIPTFTNGATATFTLDVHLSPSASGTLSNTAGASSTTPDSNPANNSSTTVSQVIGSADLSVSKSQIANLVIPDITHTYTFTVTNNGPSDAQGVTVSEPAPANTTFISLVQNSGAAFSCSLPAEGGTGTANCTIATLAAGASASFTLVVRISPVDINSIDNTVSVTSSTSDPSPANNTATATAAVSINQWKRNGLTDLIALRTTVTDKQTGKKLDGAVQHLSSSLNPGLWIDANTLEAKQGDRVFAEERAAVVFLINVIKATDGGLASALHTLVSRLITADHALADVAITQAIVAGGDATLIAIAKNQLAQGDSNAGAAQFVVAIEHYTSAWQHAEQAMKK